MTDDARAHPQPEGALTERRTRTVALLESRLDWHPPSRDSVASLPAVARPGVGAWVKCLRCEGTGRVTGAGVGAKPCRGSHAAWPYGHRCRPCLACEDGWVRAVSDDAGTDRMLMPGRHDLATEQQAKLEARAARARDERALEQQLSPAAASLADDLAATLPARWERDRDRHYREGSYRELDVALEWLGGSRPEARQLVEWAYEFRVISLGRCSASVVRVAEACVDLVAVRMPDPVRVPRWLLPREPYRGESRRSAA